MADVDLSGLVPDFADKLAQFRAAASDAGIKTTVISGYRSQAKQAALQAHPQGNPVAKPGQSFHNWGLAADVEAANPADQSKLWTLAGQYGLHALGSYDPNHFQLAGALPDLIQQFGLQGQNGGYQKPSGVAARARSLPPAAGPLANPFVNALGRAESNWRNIYSGVDPDVAGPNSRSQGYLQINTPTWQDFAPKAGVNAPNAISASLADQVAVASQIPISRFGPRTRDLLHQQFGQFDDHATVGQIAAQFGTSLASTPLGQGGIGSDFAASLRGAPGQLFPAAGSVGTGQGQNPASGVLPGFPGQEQSSDFTKGVQAMDKGLGLSPQQSQAPQMNMAQAQPRAPHMMDPGMAQQILAGFASEPGMQWGSAPPASPLQPAGLMASMPPGPTLPPTAQMQMQQLAMMSSPYGTSLASQGYGGW